MHDIFFSYVNQHSKYPLTKGEEALITAALQLKKLRRKQYFLKKEELIQLVNYFHFPLLHLVKQFLSFQRFQRLDVPLQGWRLVHDSCTAYLDLMPMISLSG